jgi:predicted nucleotidyltransferase
VSGRRAVAEVLRGLAAAMQERGLRWYLFGAQAVIVWGSPRLSADVDVTADIHPEGLDDYILAMRGHGFDLVFSDADFVERTRVLPFLHRASRMPLDVVLAGPGLEDEFLQRAISVDVEGTLVPVISPEDLIVTKVLAGRPKDVEDIRGVLHERKESLDIERIRAVLGLLERALGQSDLLPLFESELGERKPEKRGARKTGGARKMSEAKPKKK